MKNIILGVTGGIYPPTSKSENIDTIKLLQLIFAIIFITLIIIIIKNCIDIYKQNQKINNTENHKNLLWQTPHEVFSNISSK